MPAGDPRARVLVEHEDILAAGAQGGPAALVVAVVQPQRERPGVEGQRAVEVADGQVDRAKASGGRQDGARACGEGGRLRHVREQV